MRLAYIVVKDGHRHLKKEFSYSYEEFCDLLDTEENLEDAINEISAYVELVSPKETESEKNLKAPKSTGKK